MRDLIKALEIFAKYSNANWPTGCEHDVLYVYVSQSSVSDDDKLNLDELGFFPSEDDDNFYSFRFGSA